MLNKNQIKDLENITLLNKKFNSGDIVTASLNIESREYNGRWYTDIKVWDLTVDGAAGAGAPLPPAMESGSASLSGGTLPGAAPSPPAPPLNAPFEDDLPF